MLSFVYIGTPPACRVLASSAKDAKDWPTETWLACNNKPYRSRLCSSRTAPSRNRGGYTLLRHSDAHAERPVQPARGCEVPHASFHTKAYRSTGNQPQHPRYAGRMEYDLLELVGFSSRPRGTGRSAHATDLPNRYTIPWRTTL